MSDEKIFCGSGRIVSTKFGDVPKISLSKEDVNKIFKYMKENNLEWINLEMKAKKETEQGKPTHYLQVDTWKTEKKTEPKTDDDLPW